MASTCPNHGRLLFGYLMETPQLWSNQDHTVLLCDIADIIRAMALDIAECNSNFFKNVVQLNERGI